MSNCSNSLNIMTGFEEVVLPIVYLGAPIYTGRPITQMFQELKEKIIFRIGGWSAKLLLSGAKLSH